MSSPPPTEIAQLIERYQGGRTVYELGQEFGIHRVTVAKALRAAGVRLRLDGLDEADIARAVDLYADGLSLAKVGEHFGVAASTVYRAFKAQGIPRRG